MYKSVHIVRIQAQCDSARPAITDGRSHCECSVLLPVKLCYIDGHYKKIGNTRLEHNVMLRAVKHKTRYRLAFALVTLVLYFAYLLNYLPSGDFLAHRLGTSWITGSLAMFVGLIVVFILLELLFLRIDSDDDPDSNGA